MDIYQIRCDECDRALTRPCWTVEAAREAWAKAGGVFYDTDNIFLHGALCPEHATANGNRLPANG